LKSKTKKNKNKKSNTERNVITRAAAAATPARAWANNILHSWSIL